MLPLHHALDAEVTLKVPVFRGTSKVHFDIEEKPFVVHFDKQKRAVCLVIAVSRVVNTYGPQSRQKLPIKTEIATRGCGNSAIEERLQNLEVHLQLKPVLTKEETKNPGVFTEYACCSHLPLPNEFEGPAVARPMAQCTLELPRTTLPPACHELGAAAPCITCKGVERYLLYKCTRDYKITNNYRMNAPLKLELKMFFVFFQSKLKLSLNRTLSRIIIINDN
uniref:Uncharacterized protein n=1 Tax=Eptatretus burgeri TaxID=7764 RepID=A0A8C4QLR2_EPTBU